MTYVALSIGVAAAQYGQGSGAGGAQYVDANGDGMCDNIGTRPGFVDADGDGVCDNLDDFGRGRGGCGCGDRAFVDSDGDGICDNVGTPNGQDDNYKPLRDGSGNRCGYGNGCNR